MGIACRVVAEILGVQTNDVGLPRRERQQEHEQIRDSLIGTLKRLVQSKAIEATPDVEPILVRLQNWIRRENSDSIGTLLEEIAGLSRARDVAYDILLRAGRVDPRRDRFLVIAGIEEEFPAVVEEAAARLAMRNGGNRIIGISRKHHANGDLAVVGTVGGVKGAGAGVEADFAANLGAQSGGQTFGIDIRGLRGVRDFCVGWHECLVFSRREYRADG